MTTVSSRPLYTWLIIVAVGGVFYLVGQYISSEPDRIQQEVAADREITVNGTGEAFAIPDVAKVTLGVTTGPQQDAETALNLLSERANAILGAVENAGIDEDDIKTVNLSVSPQYNYLEGRQELRGFEAQQSLEVTIRDLGAVGEVVAQATAAGANQSGGVSFEVSDRETVELEAQEAAIANARAEAEAIADALGVRLGEVKSFSASHSGGEPPIAYGRAAELQAADAVATPPVPAGTTEINSQVTITYTLR